LHPKPTHLIIPGLLVLLGAQARAEELETPLQISPALVALLSGPEEFALAGGDPGQQELDIPGPVGLPEPAEAISYTRGGSSRNRREMDQRRVGIGLMPQYSVLTGDVVGSAFGSGPGGTLRVTFNMDDANEFFLDLAYSNHPMINPRAMFFRTAVTPASGYSGNLAVYAPALFYALTIPIGGDFHHRAIFVPKLFIGVGPMISVAQGDVTNAGIKGTVNGHGTQPFLQFTPGLAFDFRVYDYFFIGPDFMYRITVPTVAPNIENEFSIPKMYIFDTGVEFKYFFY
jgi:hypothetical protein